MTRKFPSSTVDHSLAIKYLTKASRFKTDAENMAQLSDEFRKHADRTPAVRRPPTRVGDHHEAGSEPELIFWRVRWRVRDARRWHPALSLRMSGLEKFQAPP
jgi:hypothetical protein